MVLCVPYKTVFHLVVHIWYTTYGEMSIYGIQDMEHYLFYTSPPNLDHHIRYTTNGECAICDITHMVSTLNIVYRILYDSQI